MLPATVEVEPLSIAKITEALAILGIDINGVKSVTLRKGYVEVVRPVVDTKGRRLVAGDDAASCTIQIPIVFPKPAEAVA